MTQLWTITYTFYVGVNLHMQYILVMRNKRLINKWILLWYVDVLVSVSPFREISRAAQVANLNPHPHLFFHISVVTYMYSRGHMGMTRCILQDPGNSRPFMTFLYDYSPLDGIFVTTPPWWDAISRLFMTKSACRNPCPLPPPTPPNTHTHAHTITEATSHKQSMLYLLQLEIQ